MTNGKWSVRLSGNLLVPHRARMLASAHSVSENGAPAAGFLPPLQKARLIIAWTRKSAFLPLPFGRGSGWGAKLRRDAEVWSLFCSQIRSGGTRN